MGASDHTSCSQGVREENGNLQADGSVDMGVYSDWEGFSNSVIRNGASQEEHSQSSVASLPDTASLLGKFPYDEIAILKYQC